MNPARSRRVQRWVRSRWVSIVGWSELAGGAVAAVVLGLRAMGIGTDDQVAARQMVLPMLVFCGLSMVAGRLLLLRHPLGRSLSIPVQAMQALYLTVGGLGVRVAAGLAVSMLYASPGGIDGTLGVDALFRIGSTGVQAELGINAVAIAALVALLRHPTLDRTDASNDAGAQMVASADA